jgi:hypothetical protein
MRQRFDQNLSLSFAGELDIRKTAGQLHNESSAAISKDRHPIGRQAVVVGGITIAIAIIRVIWVAGLPSSAAGNAGDARQDQLEAKVRPPTPSRPPTSPEQTRRPPQAKTRPASQAPRPQANRAPPWPKAEQIPRPKTTPAPPWPAPASEAPGPEAAPAPAIAAPTANAQTAEAETASMKGGQAAQSEAGTERSRPANKSSCAQVG